MSNPPVEVRSPRFAGDPHLDAIFAGLELMSFGWVDCSVKKVQQALTELGFDLGPVGVDGDFGQRTHAAVVGFQAGAALTADGIVGPVTLRTFEASVPPISARPVDCGEGPSGGAAGQPASNDSGVLNVATFSGEEFIGGANVTVRSTSDPTARFGVTNDTGRLAIGELVPGTYVISADKPGFGAGESTAQLAADEVLEAFVELIRQGQSQQPQVFGVRQLSARGQGQAFLISPFDEAQGITLDDKMAEAQQQAQTNSTTRLNEEVQREEAQLVAEHPGVTLTFRTENHVQTCDQPSVVNVSSEDNGPVVVIIQEIEAICTDSVQLVFESQDAPP
jgi:peptidoglycan hydrolase-like protein with peptidoglycan-binding domain